MRIQTKFNIFIFIILILVSLPIIVVNYVVMTQITYSLYGKLLHGELEGIYNEINASYRVIKSAGIADIKDYVTSAQQKLLEKSRHYSFGKTGFVFIINDNAQVIFHSSYTAGQKVEFEFVQQVITQQRGDFTFEYQGQVYLGTFTYFPEWKWYIILAITQDEILRQQFDYLKYLPIISITIFLSVFLLSLQFTRTHLACLQDMLGALRRAKNGYWETPMVVTRKDEIGVIEKTINMIFKRFLALNTELMQFKKALDNTVYGVFIFDTQNYQLDYVNQGVYRRLGYMEQDLLQMPPSSISAELELAKMIPWLRPLLSGEQTELTIETTSYHKNGTQIPIKITCYLFSSPCGQQRVICVMSDITQQKQIEKTLQINEERLKLALEVTSDGLWETNFITGETYFSPTYYTMLGYQPQEFQASYQNWFNLLHPDDKIRTEQTIRTHINNPNSLGFELEFRLKTKSGNWKWILGRGKIVERIATGQAQRVVGTHVDLTLHKQAQESLRAMEERFNFIIRELQDGLWDWDIRSNEIYFSPRWKQILGYEENELSNRPEEFFNRLHFDDVTTMMNRISAYLERRVATYELTVRLQHKCGYYLWVLVRGSAQWDNQGKPLRLAGTLTKTSEEIVPATEVLERITG
jgi:PAS domain S-box-containing protein